MEGRRRPPALGAVKSKAATSRPSCSPRQVVHPVLLGCWGCLRLQRQGEPGEDSRQREHLLAQPLFIGTSSRPAGRGDGCGDRWDVRTVSKWPRRYRLEAEQGLLDRSSALRQIPHRTADARASARDDRTTAPATAAPPTRSLADARPPAPAHLAYRPRTNGKAERSIRTVRARPDEPRAKATGPRVSSEILPRTPSWLQAQRSRR